MITEIIAGITQQLLNFFIPELLFLLFVEKSGKRFKFRFSEISEYPGLKPFAKTWAVGIVAFIIYFFSSPIFEFLLGSTIEQWLIHLSILKLVALTISLVGFTLIFIVNYLFETRPNRITIIVGIIAIITFIIFLQ